MRALFLSSILLVALVACDSNEGGTVAGVDVDVDVAVDVSQPLEDVSVAEVEAPPALFTFAVLADTHLMINVDEPRNVMFEEAGRLFASMTPPPELVVNVGDNIEDLFCLPDMTAGDQEVPMLTLYRGLVDEHFSMPFYAVLGNHDNRYFDTFQGNEDAWRAWLRAFEGCETLPAPYFSVDHGGFRFVIVACTDEAYDHESNDQCTIGPDQLAWLDEQLEAGLPSVLFWHHAMAPPDEEHVLDDADHILFHVIDEHADTVRAVFMGHRHRFARFSWHGVEFWETDSFKSRSTPPYNIVACDPADGSVTVTDVDEWDYVTD